MSIPIWQFEQQIWMYLYLQSLPWMITFPRNRRKLLLPVEMFIWETSTFVSIATSDFIQQICPSTTLFQDQWADLCRGKMPSRVARHAILGRDQHRCQSLVTKGWNYFGNQGLRAKWNWRRFRAGWYQNESILHGNPIWASKNARQLPLMPLKKSRETKNLSTNDASRKNFNTDVSQREIRYELKD